MEQNDMDNNKDFSILPPHIISIILSHLNFEDLKNAVQVCSLWYYASHHPLITERIRLRIVQDINLEIPEISQIVRPFDAVRISHIDFDTIDYKDFFINFGKCIKTLNIAFCNISVQQIYECLIHLRNLENFEFFESKTKPLQIEGVDSLNGFDEDNQIKIIKNLGKIKNLTFGPSLNNLLGFIPIARHTKNVEKFCLRNAWASLPINNDLIVNNLFEILNYWNLEQLKSMEIEFLSQNKNKLFYDQFIKLKTIQLKELRIMEKYEAEHNFNNTYYNQNFGEFCKQNKNLVILEMPSINDQELYDISKNIANLKQLDVGSMLVDQMNDIQNFKTLNVLRLCRFNTNAGGVEQLFSFKFDHLKELWLELIIEKVILDLIAENCEHLEILSLNLLTTDCDSIYRKLLKLKYLRLWFRIFRFVHIDNISNPNSDVNITNLKELEYLEINGYVSGIQTNHILSLPKLKHSNHKFFNFGRSIPDNGFEHIYDEDSNNNDAEIGDDIIDEDMIEDMQMQIRY